MIDTKLTGADLETALTERGLPSEGTADEKRAAVAAYDAEHPPAEPTETPDADTSTDLAVGELWTVPAASSAEVVFTDPRQRAHTVRTSPDGHGARHAQIVLDQPGTWAAVVSNGDAHTAVAK